MTQFINVTVNEIEKAKLEEIKLKWQYYVSKYPCFGLRYQESSCDFKVFRQKQFTQIKKLQEDYDAEERTKLMFAQQDYEK